MAVVLRLLIASLLLATSALAGSDPDARSQFIREIQRSARVDAREFFIANRDHITDPQFKSFELEYSEDKALAKHLSEDDSIIYQNAFISTVDAIMKDGF
jgi:hypothetical protein